MNQQKLAELANAMPNTKHVIAKNQDMDAWINQGKPRLWQVVETVNDYSVALDSGYGILALFHGNKLLDTGKNCIVYGDVVVLDKDYYGGSQYLYFAAKA